METLRKTRRPLRAQFTRKVGELETELGRVPPDVEVISVKLELLSAAYEKISSIDDRMMDMMKTTEVDINEEDEEYASIEDYRERFLTTKVRISHLLNPVVVGGVVERAPSPGAVSSVGSSISESEISRKAYKLPKIEIKKFNGELKEWLGFWAQFEKIHKDTSLHDSDKFQYLVQSMVSGTRAEKLVASYPQTAENYKLAVDALKDRYGDKVLLTEIYVRELLKLVIRNTNNRQSTSKAFSLSAIYDELDAHLRSLETLGVTVEQSAAFLYPLVESSLPVDIIRAWQRSALSGYDNDKEEQSVDNRLKSLIKFLRREVKGVERLSYVTEGFREENKTTRVHVKSGRNSFHTSSPPTAAGLFSGNTSVKGNNCVFCMKRHDSDKCVTAQSMSVKERKNKVMDAKACLLCLKPGHMAKSCKTYLSCVVCHKKHVTLMCPELNSVSGASNETKVKTVDEVSGVHSHLNCTNEVLLQTICCIVQYKDKQRRVRVLFDPGSQKSYILERTAKQLGLVADGELKLRHLLFGGMTELQDHCVYNLELKGCNDRATIPVNLLGHRKICETVPKMSKGPWMSELKEKCIFVNDLGESGEEIEVLIGANYYASWLTGRKCTLRNGLVALETCLGWTLTGELNKSTNDTHDNLAMQVVSMLSTDATVAELWRLETIGIHDPVEHDSAIEKDKKVKAEFMNTVARDVNGRYCVRLPWVAGQQPHVPNNKEIAKKRLIAMTDKLVKQGKYNDYQKMFDEWLTEDFIEVIQDDSDLPASSVYYLPHRAVFKPESVTTPVRPVFDASCKAGSRSPSLNELLEKGPNLLELLPTILLRFRQHLIGVSADIRKAFQMIEVNQEDRDFLRFLWWEDREKGTMKIYRHKRVVFGVNCSPFLLAAVLELHLNNVPDDESALAQKLWRTLYVDNCAASVNSYQEYEEFRKFAVSSLLAAKMNLRNWEITETSVDFDCYGGSNDSEVQHRTKVLGLVWEKGRDTLSCEIPRLEIGASITKRGILSYINKIFDPVGFLSPALLPLKLILQQAWSVKLSWDENLPSQAIAKLKQWFQNVECLQEIEIRRSLTGGIHPSGNQLEIHIFCDASQDAYAAVAYLRAIGVKSGGTQAVSVQMLMAKSRLSPLKKPTIPRMELLACVIGARLLHYVCESLQIRDVPVYLWSDSTTALAWIKRNDEWGTFVGNRVKEICSLTNPEDWRHVPGIVNPADLPSRGCTPQELLLSRWWEGPSWLYSTEEQWPVESAMLDENVIISECKGSARLTTKKGDYSSEVNVLINMEKIQEKGWYVVSSSYNRVIRVMAWVRRFINNSRQQTSQLQGNISREEFDESEKVIIKLVQQEEFVVKNGTIHGLRVQIDDNGIYKVKSKIAHKDSDGFRCPVILPSGHPLVDMLIRQHHVDNCHGGAQFLMSKIREKYWIIRSRKTINRVIRRCTVCLRYNSKGFLTDPAALPVCRTETCNAFQTTGVDLTGPLYLKGGDKAWLVLFTCAVYRCVHIDYVMSLSTEAFLNALERFINVRGRPLTIYSDNGTNFVGTSNLFKKLNWETIEKTANTKQINWIFNPPSAAWWGGWWERLIRIIKDLLKRMLGNARLTGEHLRTCLSCVENVVNERPLTAVTEDQNDLIPLTPAMFLRGIDMGSFPEGGLLSVCFQGQYQKRQKLQQELNQRFRTEYLSLLVQKSKEKKHKLPAVGDVVLVGDDNVRRISWPLAKITELFPGRDGVIRVAKIRTQTGDLIRPVKRLHPLEITCEADSSDFQNKSKRLLSREKEILSDESSKTVENKLDPKITNSGRVVRKPQRFIE